MAVESTAFALDSGPFVQLPGPPALALVIQEPEEADSSNWLQVGDVINVINALPSNEQLYGVVCMPSGENHTQIRSGWLPTNIVRRLSNEEIRKLRPEVVLSMLDVVRRAALVRVDLGVDEEWFEPECLPLHNGDVLQLSAAEDDWGFGRPLRCLDQAGWFPLTKVTPTNPLEPVSTDPAPVPDEAHAPTPDALCSLKDFLTSQPPPGEFDWDHEIPLPPLVDESVRHFEAEWNSMGFGFAQPLPDVISFEVPGEDVPRVAAGGDDFQGGDFEQDLDVASCINKTTELEMLPLVVVTEAFKPSPEIPEMLELNVGDLVRVSTPLHIMMYHGTLEPTVNKANSKEWKKGWFPKKFVEVVERPPGTMAKQIPAEMTVLETPPPLEIPRSLREARFDNQDDR